MEAAGGEQVPGIPAQPDGAAPLPPPPPRRIPSEQEKPGGALAGDGSIVPPELDEVAAEGEEEEEAQQETAVSRGASAVQVLSLSGELVPVTAGKAAEDNTPNYYDWRDLFPALQTLVDGMSEISRECGQVAAWKAWPEKHYDEGGAQDWKVRLRSALM